MDKKKDKPIPKSKKFPYNSAKTHKEWPGTGKALAQAGEALGNNSTPYVFYLIIFAIVEVLVLLFVNHSISNQLDPQTIASLAGSVVGLIFLPYMTSYELSLSKKARTTIFDHFNLGFKKYLLVYLTIIMFSILLFVGALLILIPLIWLLPMFYLVLYPVVDLNYGPIRSIKYVWALTKDNLGKIWSLIGLYFVVGIGLSLLISNKAVASFLSSIVAIFFETAIAILYRWLKANTLTSES